MRSSHSDASAFAPSHPTPAAKECRYTHGRSAVQVEVVEMTATLSVETAVERAIREPLIELEGVVKI